MQPRTRNSSSRATTTTPTAPTRRRMSSVWESAAVAPPALARRGRGDRRGSSSSSKKDKSGFGSSGAPLPGTLLAVQRLQEGPQYDHPPGRKPGGVVRGAPNPSLMDATEELPATAVQPAAPLVLGRYRL